MIKIAFLILFYFTFPLVIIIYAKNGLCFRSLDAIVLAYGFGLILGTSGIFPEGSEQYKLALQGRAALPARELEKLLSDGVLPAEDKYVNQIASVQDFIPSIVVPLAFPLLLFSLDIRRWLKYAKKGFISVALALVAGLVNGYCRLFYMERLNSRKLEACWYVCRDLYRRHSQFCRN